MTLRDIRPGCNCEVVGLSPELPDRLLELGLMPGTHIEVVRTAPFGDPVAYRIKNAQLAIGRAEAALIFVDAL